MNFSESLKKNTDFRKVYHGGHSKANKYLVIYIRKNGTDKNRVGISVSKKVGNSVVRHHMCRLIREGYRLQEEYFHIGYDMVFIVRVNAKDCTYKQIESAIYELAKAHHILKEV